MELQAFGLINWLVLGAYLCANVVLGFVLSKKAQLQMIFLSGSEIFLGGLLVFQLSLPM